MLITELPQTLQEFFRSRMYAALALYRLYHNGDGILGAGILESLQIIEGCIGKAIGHGTEADLAGITGLAGSGHSAEGSAVEAFLCRYDVVSVRTIVLYAVLTSHLDHSLVSLCTGVLEEDFIHADGLTNLLC